MNICMHVASMCHVSGQSCLHASLSLVFPLGLAPAQVSRGMEARVEVGLTGGKSKLGTFITLRI